MNFTCTKCSMTFLKKNKLIQHNFDVHRISKSFNCKKCNYVGPSSESLRRHTKSEHETDLNRSN